MAIFNSYVKLPEGKGLTPNSHVAPAVAGVLGTQDQGAGGPSCLGPEADGTRDGGDQDIRCVPQADKQLEKHIYIYKQLHCCRKSWVWRTSWSTLRWVTLLTLLTIPAIPTDETRPVNLRLDAQGELRARKIASNMAVKDQWLCQTCDPVTWQRHQGSWQIVELRFYDFIWLFVCFCPMRYFVSLLKNHRTLMRRQPTPKEQRQDFAVAFCEWWEKDEPSNACLVYLCQLQFKAPSKLRISEV